MKLHMHVLIALGLGLKRNWHIFFGLIAGVIVGIFLHSHQNPLIMGTLTVIGQLFIRLIQMIVIPLVISAIVIELPSLGISDIKVISPLLLVETMLLLLLRLFWLNNVLGNVTKQIIKITTIAIIVIIIFLFILSSAYKFIHNNSNSIVHYKFKSKLYLMKM